MKKNTENDTMDSSSFETSENLSQEVSDVVLGNQAPMIGKFFLPPKNKKKSGRSDKKSKKSRSTKRKLKKSKSDIEFAIQRYKLRFVNDSTSNQIARLNRVNKDPTEKLMNKIFKNKNENALGDKFLRRINHRNNLLQDFDLNQLRTQKLDRGNKNGISQRRDVEIQTNIFSRNSLLDIIDSNENIPGAFSRGVGDDIPPPQSQEEDGENIVTAEIDNTAIIEARDYNEAMKEKLEQFNEFYKGLYGKNPNGNLTRGLKTEEDILELVDRVQKQYDELMLPKMARELDDESKDDETLEDKQKRLDELIEEYNIRVEMQSGAEDSGQEVPEKFIKEFDAIIQKMNNLDEEIEEIKKM